MRWRLVRHDHSEPQSVDRTATPGCLFAVRPLQTRGCIAFGLGQALFEEMLFDGGQLQNGNLGDYMIASMLDMPPIGVSIVEHPQRTEIHGLGETSLPPVMAAVGNAVQRATGIRIRDLPITPEKLLRALRA